MWAGVSVGVGIAVGIDVLTLAGTGGGGGSPSRRGLSRSRGTEIRSNLQPCHILFYVVINW